MTNVKQVMVSLAELELVRKSLTFLAEVGVVREEAIVKGCRKYVKDHPEINEYMSKLFPEDSE